MKKLLFLLPLASAVVLGAITLPPGANPTLIPPAAEGPVTRAEFNALKADLVRLRTEVARLRAAQIPARGATNAPPQGPRL